MGICEDRITEDDVVADFTVIITSFNECLYSKIRGKNKAHALKKCSEKTQQINNY